MKIIGITGAIGCGKTTVADMVRNLGYEIFDADLEVKKIYENKNFLMNLRGAFPRIFDKDGLPDKRQLRSLVFHNQKELLKLEDIVEPFLSDVFLQKINEAARRQGWLFIDAALLIEKGWDKYCDKVICVSADLETQKKRVMERDGISEEEFYDIYHLQMENDKKCALADEVLDTQCSPAELETRVKTLLKKLKVL